MSKETRIVLRKIMQVSYSLATLCIVAAFILSMVNFPVHAERSEAAVLVFISGCSGCCDSISATVENNGQSVMESSTTYEVELHPQGGNWQVVGSGTIPILQPGDTYTISYNPNGVSGLYRFKVYQPAGSPQSGVIYSGTCSLDCSLPPDPTPTWTNSPTPVVTTVTPTSTFTMTPTPEEPTSTPEEPTETPETATPTPEDPSPTPEEPTPTPEGPTATPEEPTSTPEGPTATPEEPTPTPEGPTPTPQEPTPTPEGPTATPQEPTPTQEEPTEQPTMEPTQNPTEEPTGTAIIPVTGETPTPKPSQAATLAAPSVQSQQAVLIPVTGADHAEFPLKKILFNMGLCFFGLGLLIQGIRKVI